MSDKKFNNLMCTNFECAMHVQLAEYCYLHLYYEIMKEQGFNITIEANQNLSEIQFPCLRPCAVKPCHFTHQEYSNQC